MKEIKVVFIIDNKIKTGEYTILELLEMSGEEAIFEDLESERKSCNCFNESQNHCECDSLFEESKITNIEVIN